MRVHSLEKVKLLKKLRREGYSINELVHKFSIPKTTVWHHIHEVPISEKYISQWRSKYGGSAKRRERNLQLAKETASQLIRGPYKDYLIALSMLYWGEGSKKACEFINSDGDMIKLYLIILRKVLNISESAIKPTMRIFTGMDEEECLAYWSKITSIPKSNFIIRFNDGGSSGKTKFGMCRITVRKGHQTLKIIHSLREQILINLQNNLIQLPS